MREMLRRFFRGLFPTDEELMFAAVPARLQGHVRNLSHPEDEKKLEALKALKKEREPSTIPFIGRLVVNGNRQVKHEAIDALDAMNHRKAIIPLVDALDPNDLETMDRASKAITKILNLMQKQGSR